MYIVNTLNKILSILLVWTFLSTNIAYPGTDTLRPALFFGTNERREIGHGTMPSTVATDQMRMATRVVLREAKIAIETITDILSRKYIAANQVSVMQTTLEKLKKTIQINLLSLPAKEREALSTEIRSLDTFFSTLEDIIKMKEESTSSDYKKYVDARADIQLDNIKSSISRMEKAVANLEAWLQEVAVASAVQVPRSAGAVERAEAVVSPELPVPNELITKLQKLVNTKGGIEIDAGLVYYRDGSIMFDIGEEEYEAILTLLSPLMDAIEERGIEKIKIDKGQNVADVLREVFGKPKYRNSGTIGDVSKNRAVAGAI